MFPNVSPDGVTVEPSVQFARQQKQTRQFPRNNNSRLDLMLCCPTQQHIFQFPNFPSDGVTVEPSVQLARQQKQTRELPVHDNNKLELMLYCPNQQHIFPSDGVTVESLNCPPTDKIQNWTWRKKMFVIPVQTVDLRGWWAKPVLQHYPR